MLKRYHQVFGTIFKLIDGGVITVAWLSSYWLRFKLPIIEVTKGFPSFSTYAALTPLVVVIWWIVFSSFKVYQSQRMLKRTDEALLVIRSHLVSLVLFVALTYLFSEYTYSRGVMLYFAILGAVALVGFRLILRNILRNLRKKGYNLRYAIAVGEGPLLETLLWRLRKFPELGIKVKGIVTATPSDKTEIWEAKILGSLKDFKSIYDQTKPDQLMIALPRTHQDQIHEILNSFKEEMVDIQLIPDLHEYITLGCEVEDFEGLPIVNLNDTPLQGVWIWVKRFMDLVLSGLALLLLSPFFVIIALAVKLRAVRDDEDADLVIPRLVLQQRDHR
jgi:FlaA1/EpsC-like NDP-sugar epimerase